jgi:hypothetical protein
VFITSHAYWTWRATRSRPARALAVLGSVAPDLPAAILTPVLAARGRARTEMLDAVYHDERWSPVHMAAHSVFAPLALVAGGRRARWVAAGWAGHLFADYFTHHSDAWPPAWPVSSRRWASPVSYWEHEFHALAYQRSEAVALTVATLTDAHQTRRMAGVVAAALVAAPAIASRRRNVWALAGAMPDRHSRARDLAKR